MKSSRSHPEGHNDCEGFRCTETYEGIFAPWGKVISRDNWDKDTGKVIRRRLLEGSNF